MNPTLKSIYDIFALSPQVSQTPEFELPLAKREHVWLITVKKLFNDPDTGLKIYYMKDFLSS